MIRFMNNSSPIAQTLAEKLVAEGQRTSSFFEALDDAVWSHVLYEGPPRWDVGQTFEHLTLAEEELLALISRVAAGGEGAPLDFNIDLRNAERLEKSGVWARDDAFIRYRAQRAATSERVAQFSDHELARRGRHPAMGDSSVADMCKMIYLHNTLHIKDIKRLLQQLQSNA
jgi:hypothetical protein